MKSLIKFSFFLLCVSVGSLSFAALNIDVFASNFVATKLVILTDNQHDAIGSIVSKDLSDSGLFEIQIQQGRLITKKTDKDVTVPSIDYATYQKAGDNLLLKLQTRNHKLSFVLYDILLQKKVSEFSVTFLNSTVNDLAHSISNLIYKYVTQDTSPFKSKIAYILKSNKSSFLIMRSFSGEQRQVLDSGLISGVSFSANGDKLAYSKLLSKGKNVVVILDINTGQRTVIKSDVAQIFSSKFTGEKHIFFTKIGSNDDSGVFYANASLGNNKRLIDSNSINITANGDSKYFVFTSDRAGTPAIYASKDNEITLLLNNQNNKQSYYAPFLSKKANIIAYVKEQDNIFSVEIKSLNTQETKVFFKGIWADSPVLSLDNRFLLFVSGNPIGSSSLKITSINKRKLRTIEEKGSIIGVAISPYISTVFDRLIGGQQ